MPISPAANCPPVNEPAFLKCFIVIPFAIYTLPPSKMRAALLIVAVVEAFNAAETFACICAVGTLPLVKFEAFVWSAFWTFDSPMSAFAKTITPVCR
jgi:hypothetical protein